jgi:hypothetical protein
MTLSDLNRMHPDLVLPPSEEFAGEYVAKASLGMATAAGLKVAFVAIARNAMPFLPRTLSMLDEAATCFEKSTFYIHENDSTDGTKEFLSRWQDGDSRRCSMQDIGRPHLNYTKAAERTHALAEYRNACRDWVGREARDVDYVVVFDTDPWGGLSVGGLFNTIGHLELSHREAVGMAAYSWCEWGQPVWPQPTICHYDAWACRWNYWAEQENMLWFHLWHPLVGSPPVRMNSAFGQLAVYRASDYLRGEYRGGDCEHVSFHRSLGGDFFLNPSMRVVSFWVPRNEVVSDGMHGRVHENVERGNSDSDHS